MSVVLDRAGPRESDGPGAAHPPGAVAEPYAELLRRLAQAPPVVEANSALVERAIRLWAHPGFEVFMCLPELRFEPFDFQLKAATTALGRMRGRAILADEVGLGKTIEACLVLMELRLRGLARRSLVLAPPGLIGQWQEELERKFGLPSVVLAAGNALPEPPSGADAPVAIASLATARRPALGAALAAVRWDLVVVDEAHRLKNPRSASARAVQALTSRHLLLLTATPVENRLDDLFQLTSLVSPGLLGSPKEFRARHGSSDQPRNLPGLRSAMLDVMVRHRRSEVALMLPRRTAKTLCVTPSADEAELYAAVSERVRAEARGAAPSRRLALLAVQRMAGSSPAVIEPILAKVGWQDLAQRAAALAPSAKARTLIELLRRSAASSEKVIVFTAFRQTLDYLAAMADAAGIPSACYHGSLNRQAKEEAIHAFAADTPVLLTTEAAGEGRNLQFCHALINVDLPWNPMQIEQRLGRVHRIGQTHDVTVTNLVARGTVEEQVLRLLEAKINLFELVVGELDMILGQVDHDFDLESFVFEAHVSAADDQEFHGRLEALGDDLAAARRSYLEARRRTDDLIGTEEPHPANGGA